MHVAMVLLSLRSATILYQPVPGDYCEPYGSVCHNAGHFNDMDGICTQSQCGRWDETTDQYVVWECGRCKVSAD